MSTDKRATVDPADESVITGMVLPTFEPPARLPSKPASSLHAAVVQSLRWQQQATKVEIGELQGTAIGMERGRIAELCTEEANAGEQLGLAVTAARDYLRWLGTTPADFEAWGPPGVDLPDDTYRVMRGIGARAAAEQIAHYAISCGHVLGNLTLRVFLVDPEAHCSFRDPSGPYPNSGGFTPFSELRGTRPPLDKQLIRNLRREAKAREDENLDALVSSLRSLYGCSAWRAMTERRNEDYHRWRAPSVPGSAAHVNPWTQELDGRSWSMAFGAPGYNFRPLDPESLRLESLEVIGALTECLRLWRDARDAYLQRMFLSAS